ncbi:MAG: hypothetical protein FJW84_01095 [Actinobacteria bacterium]|nr:hypothetical protein [Actinomycetota bacterium]
MKNYFKKSAVYFALISIFSIFAPTASTAITGTIPQPIIGAAQGFYAGESYPALFGALGTWNLQPAEVMKSVAILVYQVDLPGAACGPAVNTSKFVSGGSKRLNDSTTKTDASWITNFTVPETAANKTICAISQLTTSSGVYESARTYATVALKPDAAVTATPSPAATVEKPSISKPAFATSPKVGVKAKATIKKVTMNGNEFKSRSVTLYVCDKSDCSDKSESNATKYSDLKDTDAKTITMPEAKGKKDQYVVLYDRVVYGPDLVVEKASSIKKLSVATASASASPTVTEEEVVEATPETTMEEMAQPTPEATPVEAAITSSSISMGVVLGVLGTLVIALLIVIIVLLSRKKK